MGWLRKTFKKFGKGIKKLFMKFGKFMGKIGVLGQLAMMFILPGIGQAIGGAIKSFIGQTAAQAGAQAAGTAAAQAASTTAANAGASAAAQAAAGQAAFKTAAAAATKAGIKGTATGLFAAGNSAAAKAAGHLLQFGGKVASAPFKAFQSVTNAVTSTIGEFTKTAASKLNIPVKTAADSFFGADSAFSRVGESVRSPFSATARAEIATRKAGQLFAKEGFSDVAFENTLAKGAEAASVEMDSLITGMTDRVVSPRVPMGPAGTPLGDSLKLPEGEFVQTSMSPTDSLMAKPQGMSLEDFSQDFSVTPQEGLVSYTNQSGQVMYGPENILETMQSQGIDTTTINRTPLGTVEQLGADLKKVGTDFIDYTSEGIAQKKAALTDPAAVLQAGASVAQSYAADSAYMDRQAQLLSQSGEVINVGIIQNPELLAANPNQMLVSPISNLQSTQQNPLSLWSQGIQQQFQNFNPFAQIEGVRV